jgi:ubiquitin-conjugating enzyme E2 M
MLNLLKLKQEKAAAKESGGEEGGKAGGKVIPAAQRRVQKDLKTGIEKNSWCEMEFPDPDDIMSFTVTLKPDEGFWKGGSFTFKFEIPADYPHSPPKTLCVTKLFHPNIDVEGKVCLNILRDDWKPVLGKLLCCKARGKNVGNNQVRVKANQGAHAQRGHTAGREWADLCDVCADIGAVINGLFFLFLEPNPQDPLNKEAAELMKENLPAFVSIC